jgi:hypothetical protein
MPENRHVNAAIMGTVQDLTVRIPPGFTQVHIH